MAIQKPEWFKVDPAKFLSDSQVDMMSTLELGACFRLLCRQWLDGFIPDDLRQLARLCRLDATAMGEAWVTLCQFFPVVEPGRRANRFMWVEREKVMAEIERRSDEGTKAARKRWAARKLAVSSASATPNGLPMPHPLGDPMQDQKQKQKQKQRGETEKAPPPFHVEQSSEPETSTFGPTPEDLPPMMLAKGMIEQLGIPFSKSLLVQIADCITAKAKSAGVTYAEAHDYIRNAALAAKGTVEKWIFWFQDAGYEPVKRQTKADKADEWLRARNAQRAAGGTQ